MNESVLNADEQLARLLQQEENLRYEEEKKLRDQYHQHTHDNSKASEKAIIAKNLNTLQQQQSNKVSSEKSKTFLSYLLTYLPELFQMLSFSFDH